MVSVCLGCEHFPLQHTAINLAEYLKNITIEWKINNKVVAVVTDNAANMVSAVRQLHFRHIGCFAHSINLVVQNSLENISEIVSKVKKIVEFFKRSSNALTKLQSTQAQMGLPLLKLKQDCVTRWNSTFDMLKRIICKKDAVISTLALLQSSIDTLTPEEWDIVDKAILILQIFNEVTIEVSSEKTVSLSKKIVLVSSTTATVNTYVDDISLPHAVHQMAVSLKNELQKRFKDIEETEIVAQASILDPRFKKYGFTDEVKYKNAYTNLRTRIGNIRLPSTPSNNLEQAPTTSTSQPPVSLLWKIYEDKVEKFKSTVSSTAAGIIELDKYLGETLIDRKDDPLKWWYERKHIYPHLYEFAMKRLCVTATSVPCERIFSEAGQIITQKRNRLNTKKASQLIFLHNNLS
ncbi:E3 SUMO-protein ligase ZBED1-like [Rhopalosiphum padi]|uniref:E3 SUMO-protein ligase ZBED1-like n=1 Tax=Rhopalosiphum padi TaxID=40932 RepID=UPI00298E53A7|nr:E3 SUMO-protein ligase ZBED1-like [Rhopalosiphum padi]XP_060853298.1 E3 SUMO-protein ligase ZBED1-like [Rhopalosiphum padi]XP_060853317.1 E3 SUMO-protein ligase ZBED1-like [Rhopalosiphum padi]